MKTKLNKKELNVVSPWANKKIKELSLEELQRELHTAICENAGYSIEMNQIKSQIEKVLGY